MNITTDGESDIWGCLLQIDRTGPTRALLGLRGDERFWVEITPEIADQAERERLIGTDVGLAGTATWRLADWALLSFRASRLLEYRPDRMSLVETFEALAKVSKGRWDGVDVEAYVRDLRSE